MKFKSSLIALAAVCLGLAPGLEAQTSKQPKLKGYFAYKPAHAKDVQNVKEAVGALSNIPGLPLWNYTWQASRDNNVYTGTMVGSDPFSQHNNTSVPTYVVPIILQTNTIGSGFNPNTGIISTHPGATRFDPTAPDYGCLAAPNNVPLTLFEQSPLLANANFNFGGTSVGDTQYVDAFQRAEFWQEIGSSVYSNYHVRLAPHVLAPIFINVPAQYGTTLPQNFFPSCGPMGIIDINWFDSLMTNQVLPSLYFAGVNPSTFPILFVHNVVWAFSPTNLGECCILGYHGATGAPIQTYSPADFDTTGLFGAASKDTAVLSHEIGEWVNDPFGNNLVPAWGGTGQVVGGCQANLEVGDPLSGTQAPPVYMPNGFTYHLQELAFFSWFMGQPSIGLHNWYSDNATFLNDAGPVCSSAFSSSRTSASDELKIVVPR